MTMPAKDIYHDCVKIALIKDGSADVKDDPCDASASGGNS
ncbi:MAG: element excision factor XisH family protein [Microcystis sp.]